MKLKKQDFYCCKLPELHNFLFSSLEIVVIIHGCILPLFLGLRRWIKWKQAAHLFSALVVSFCFVLFSLKSHTYFWRCPAHFPWFQLEAVPKLTDSKPRPHGSFIPAPVIFFITVPFSEMFYYSLWKSKFKWEKALNDLRLVIMKKNVLIFLRLP